MKNRNPLLAVLATSLLVLSVGCTQQQPTRISSTSIPLASYTPPENNEVSPYLDEFRLVTLFNATTRYNEEYSKQSTKDGGISAVRRRLIAGIRKEAYDQLNHDEKRAFFDHVSTLHGYTRQGNLWVKKDGAYTFDEMIRIWDKQSIMGSDGDTNLAIYNTPTYKQIYDDMAAFRKEIGLPKLRE